MNTQFLLKSMLSLLVGLTSLTTAAAPPKETIYLAKEDGTRQMASVATRHKAPAKLPSLNENLLYGSLIDTDATWSDYGLGIYSVPYDGSKLTDITKVVALDDLTTFAGVYADGRYYAITRLKAMETFYLDVYNATTWELETYYSLGIASVRYVPNDLAYDPVTELAYGVVYDYDNLGKFCLLYQYDLRKGSLQYVGTTKLNNTVVPILAMSATVDGQLYGISNEGIMYKIDKTTAAVERMGATGVPKISSLQGSTFTAKDEFLWAAYDTISYNSALYKITLPNTEATKLSDFPHNENMTGLFTAAPFAKAKAPAAISDLALNTTPGSLNGKISFTMPSKTVDGQTLTDQILTTTIRIYHDVETDGIIETESQDIVKTYAPGATVTYEWQMQQTQYFVSVTIANQAGKSENAVLRYWAGHDYPAAIIDLKLERDADGNGVLTWTPPTEGYNGGYFDASSLTYKIVRLPGNIVVEESYKTSEGKYTDKTIEKVGTYQYKVTPVSSGGEGPTATTLQVGLGAFSTIPYSETFDTKEAFDLWTVVDLNWHEFSSGNWSSSWGYGNQCLTYVYEPLNAADDWVISPPIQMEAGAVYQVKFKAWADMANYPENLKVMVGTSTDPADMTIFVADYPNIKETSDLSDWKSGTLSVPEDGLYRIGFYCYSDAGMATLRVDNVSIDLVSGIDAPGAVTSLSATAGPQGECKASISFKAPEKTGSGSELEGLERIEIYCNGSTVAATTISPVEKGKPYSWTDNNPSDMETNTYKVIAFNSFGAGYPAETSVYVGIDTPEEVGNLFLKRGENGEAIITWDAPTVGKNGGYVNPADLTYNITDNSGNPIASRIRTTEFTDEDTPVEKQKMVFYTVKAVSDAGSNEGTNSNAIIFGEPYKLPFAESFAGGTGTQTSPWTIIGATSVSFDWHVLMQSQNDTPAAMPQDGDSGFAQFTSYSIPKGDEATLTSPLIDLTGEIDPEFSFYFYHYATENDYQDAIQPMITIDEGLTLEALGEPIVATANADGWTKYTYSLNDYSQHSRVRVGLKGISDYGYNIFVDNIRVYASSYPKVTDLSARLDGNKVVLTWSDPVYEGLELIGYNVYRDNKMLTDSPIGDLTYTDELKDGDLHTYTVTAVYQQGESGHSNAVSLSASAEMISNVCHVYSANRSIIIQGSENATIRVFRTDGTLAHTCLADNVTRIPMASAGIYVVTIDGQVYKVIVK